MKCLNLDLKESKDSSGTSLDQIMCKYRVTSTLYVQCLSSINDRLENALSIKAVEASSSHSFHVSPYDIEIFSGDYLKWSSDINQSDINRFLSALRMFDVNIFNRTRSCPISGVNLH